MRTRSVALAAGLCVALTAPAAMADVVVLGASADNTLYENDLGGLSNGIGPAFFVGDTQFGGTRRGLIRFDIAGAIPAGAEIQSVVLTLHVSRSVSGPQATTLHRVTSAWGEGESYAPGAGGNGAAAEPGDATWLHTFYSDQFWATPGGDFVAAASGQTAVDGFGFVSWSSTAGMVADAQAWLDDPSMNFGWLIRGNESEPGTAKRFDSREHPTEAFRPQLVITYIPGPSAAALLALPAIAGMRRRRR